MRSIQRKNGTLSPSLCFSLASSRLHAHVGISISCKHELLIDISGENVSALVTEREGGRERERERDAKAQKESALWHFVFHLRKRKRAREKKKERER